MMPDIVTVDEYDCVIGHDRFKDVHKTGIWHRTSHIFLFLDESYRDLLLQVRGKTLVERPLLYQTSAAGHVDWNHVLDEPESYRETAEKEFAEELFSLHSLPEGLTLDWFARTKIVSRPTNKEFGDLYISVLDNGKFEGNLSPHPEEVEAIEWTSLDVLKDDLHVNPNKYTTTFKITLPYLLAHLESKNQWKG
ncbi:NUDIX domain-containing protein [Candidatus Woesearchaeota archaeon]|nr:NUDIX domain-containing protein [Candidatus Woesearchaeota archaeon]